LERVVIKIKYIKQTERQIEPLDDEYNEDVMQLNARLCCFHSTCKSASLPVAFVVLCALYTHEY
jgi:hypothetical protein